MDNNDVVKLFGEIMEKAKTDKKLVRKLKELAVVSQKFEMAAHLRDLERSFPETEQEKEAKEVQTCLSMVGLSTTPDVAWKCLKAIQGYLAKKGEFDLMTASDIKVEAKKLESE